jgi:hypothetical protein
MPAVFSLEMPNWRSRARGCLVYHFLHGRDEVLHFFGKFSGGDAHFECKSPLNTAKN